MTAFGRSSLTTEMGSFTVEIQTLNRKHLEIHLHIAEELVHLDPIVRKWITDLFKRGNLTLKIKFICLNESFFKIHPNLQYAKQLKSSWEEILNELNVPFIASEFVPLLIEERKNLLIREENGEQVQNCEDYLKKAFDIAADACVKMKETEGLRIQNDIEQRLKTIRLSFQQIIEKAPNAVIRYREKLLHKLEELFPEKAENEEKVLREIAVYTDRLDISEEITRFLSHIQQFADLMIQEDHAGKTFEFLLQELQREINTIGSKSADFEISQVVIMIKAELERIREQIQNVE